LEAGVEGFVETTGLATGLLSLGGVGFWTGLAEIEPDLGAWALTLVSKGFLAGVTFEELAAAGLVDTFGELE